MSRQLRELLGRLRLVAHAARDEALRDPRLLWALLRTPRRRFLPTADQPAPAEPRAASSLAGQTVTDAPFVARMIAAARLPPGARVLEIGTGTGYQAAVLAAMGCQVTTVEIVPALHALAAANLARCGHADAVCRLGDGAAGAPDRAPFDAILVACAAPAPSPALLDQLAPGGRLLMPEGPPDRVQTLVALERTPHGWTRIPLQAVWFVPMVTPAEGE